MITNKVDVRVGHYVVYQMEGKTWIEKIEKIKHDLDGIKFCTRDDRGYECTITDLFDNRWNDKIYETWEEVLENHAEEFI